MMQLAQVAGALQDLALGAEALRHAARASNGRPGVALPAGFTHNVAAAPLSRLAALLGCEVLVVDPVPAAQPVRARRSRPPRKVTAKPKVDRSKELAEFIERSSAWDPDAEYSPYTDQAAEVGGCRALLLEVIRRASFDWVLYRNSSKLAMRALAEDAFHWLFVEDEESAAWKFRERTGKGMMSFLAICDAMDIDPKVVRARAKLLTEKDIMGAGRPAERRKLRPNEDAMSADEHTVFDVDVNAIPTHDPMFSAHDHDKPGFGSWATDRGALRG